MKSLICIIFMLNSGILFSQNEFPSEFILHGRLHTGLQFAPNNPFAGGFHFTGQQTIIQHKIRGGLTTGMIYTNQKMYGMLGPTISIKIKEIPAGYFGSAGNIHLNIDHWWSTGKHYLAGAGINLDLLNKIILSLFIHRDYYHGNWWIQSGISFRISKPKQPIETFPH